MIADKSKIRKGMNITVVKALWGQDRSFQGDVLKVVTVQRPFIIVDKKHFNKYIANPKTGKDGMVVTEHRHSIKLDDYEFMQLSRKYVRAKLQQN